MCVLPKYHVRCWMKDCNKIWLTLCATTVEKCEDPNCIETKGVQRNVRFDDWHRVFCKACYERRNDKENGCHNDYYGVTDVKVVNTIKRGFPLDGRPEFDADIVSGIIWGVTEYSVRTNDAHLLGRCTPPVFYTREGIS